MYKLCLFLFIFIYILLINFFKSSSIKKLKNDRLVPLGYSIFYSDEKTKFKKQNIIYSKLLFSKKYNIQGKPDYILRKKNKYIPIELKSAKIKNKAFPNQGDLLQLVTYFLIIEDVYGIKPKYGKIVYADYTFIVKNKPYLKKLLLKTLKKMRIMLKNGKGVPNNSFQNCKHCLCKLTVCKYYKDN